MAAFASNLKVCGPAPAAVEIVIEPLLTPVHAVGAAATVVARLPAEATVTDNVMLQAPGASLTAVSYTHLTLPTILRV